MGERRAGPAAHPLSLSRIVLTALLGALAVLALSPSPARASVFVNDARWPIAANGYATIPICIVQGSSVDEKADGSGSGLIHDPNPSLDQVILHIRRALGATWEQYGGVRFVGWGRCEDLSASDRANTVGFYLNPNAANKGQIGTGARGHTTASDYGAEILPWGNTFNRCISYDANTTHEAYSFDCAEQYAVHELGHVLGFDHEVVNPATPIQCRDSGQPIASPGSWSTTFDPNKTYTIVNPSSFDSLTHMFYGGPCMQTNGVRFGSVGLSPTDIRGLRAVYPPAARGPYDVGVLADTGGYAGSCAGNDGLTIHMDDEDDNNADSSSGWLGASVVDSNTTLRFCRIDGRLFGKVRARPGLSGDYAVLKLGPVCPPGSIEFVRHFDNEDHNNDNYTIGDTGPNGGGANTDLHFCYFRPDNAGGTFMAGFPSLGVSYGVFAPFDLAGAATFGFIHTDDEDHNNADSLTDAYGSTSSFSAAVRAGIGAIVSGSTNTDLSLARISPPAPTSLYYTGTGGGDYGDPAAASAVLVDTRTGYYLAGEPIVFAVNGGTCTGITDSTGTAACGLTPRGNAYGNFSMQVTFAGDGAHAASRGLYTGFSQTQEETQLAYTGDRAAARGGTATLAAILQQDDRSPVANRTLTLSLGSQSCSGNSDLDGKVACTIANVSAAPGAQQATASFAGDPLYLAASTSATIDVRTTPIVRAATTLRYTGPGGGDYGAPVAVSASLTDGGGAVASVPLVFTLDGADTCTAIADSNGSATCTLTPGEDAGVYALGVHFAGDSAHLSSDTSDPFAVARMATSLQVDAAAGRSGGSVALSATLHAGGAGLDGQLVAFTLDGAAVGSATTANGGVATLPGVSLALVGAGAYPAGVGASFAGDATHLGATGTAALAVRDLLSQTITFATPRDMQIGDPPQALQVSASSGLAVSIAADPAASAICKTFGVPHLTVQGFRPIVTFTWEVLASGPGSCTLTASQAGDTDHGAAPDVGVSFQVAGSIIVDPPPDGSQTPEAPSGVLLGVGVAAVAAAWRRRAARRG